MCGIFGYVGVQKNATSLAFSGIKLLEYRGYDSWGVAHVTSDDKPQLCIEKHVGKIGNATLTNKSPSSLAVGHTRWATHGGVTIINAHPHKDAENRIAVVHNGIVENYQTLRAELQQKGYVFISETDTEVIVHMIADFLQSLSLVDAVRKTFEKLDGLNAFVVICKDSEELVAVRKGSPLVLGKSEHGYFVASDAVAIREHAQRVHFVEENEMIVCNKKDAYLYDAQTLEKKEFFWKKLEFEQENLRLGKYKHFMLKEIAEQPKILLNIASIYLPQVRIYANSLKQHNIFTGCGSAYHAALAYSYLFGLIAGKKTEAVIGSELGYHIPHFTKDMFVSFVSQSGETIDIVEHALSFQKKKIPFGAIVNRLGSSLERMAATKILLGAGPEQCVLATKSFTAKLAVGLLLAHTLAGTYEEGVEQLKAVSKNLSKLLQQAYIKEHIDPVANSLFRSRNLFVIGRGLSFPMALEAALKIKESTYIHAEGFAGGDLKHGVIALIEKGTPCIVLAPQDETYASIISNAIEMKTRGAHIIGIAAEKNAAFDQWIPIEDVGRSTMITQSVVMQLLAYKLCLLLGSDPDKPRNLAKSVVVK